MSILDKFRLDGRVAIVTGGNRGLGKEMSAALVEAGAKVAVVSRKTEEAQAAASAYGGSARGYGCDVTEPEQVEAMVSQVAADFGGVDILVNNAGVNIRGAIDELSLEEFQQVQNINVTGVWLVTRAAAPHLKASNYGRVINIGSTLSIIALPERTPYASSKGAVLQMTRALALEWASRGITVNAVLPGPFATDMNLPLMQDEEKYRAFLSLIPLGRWGELDEIGGLIVFLAGDAASFITGAGITIDGGWTAR
jgi:gluconate 5-dehydrogenase